jgi:tetratricopeptide (TPR) repeat protein
MTTYQAISRITDLLNRMNLSWILPNLRQDNVVWNYLTQLNHLDDFIQDGSIGAVLTPEDLAPSKLALRALGQIDLANNETWNILESIDDQIVKSAIRSFNDLSIFLADRQNLATAGLLALALANKYQTSSSWTGVLEVIRDKPDYSWQTAFTCLYGLLKNPAGLLNSLVQPGASAERFSIAVHIVLSNPLSSAEQIEIFLGLAQGAYGDFLPARERLLLVQKIHEQNPHLAKKLCLNWLEIQPESNFSDERKINRPIDSVYQLSEILFEVELNKIAGNYLSVPDLLDAEKKLSQTIPLGILTHCAAHQSINVDKELIDHELLTLREQLLYLSNYDVTEKGSDPYLADLALTLSDHGLISEAIELLPGGDSLAHDDLTSLYAIAVLSLEMQDVQRARAVVELIVEMIDQDVSVDEIPVWDDHLSLVNLGKLLISLGELGRATRVLELALRTCPADIALLGLLAKAYHDTHKVREAAMTYTLLVSLDPETLDHHRALAESLETLGDWENALLERSLIVELLRQHSTNTSNDDEYAFAKCALNANQLELTLKICSELLSKNQEDYQALIYTGKARIQGGDLEVGINYLERATHISPHLPEAWLALAEIHKSQGSIKTVIDTLINASHAVSQSPQIYFALGDMYLLDNTPTLALRELRTATELQPDNPQFLVGYGKALKLLGHLNESQSVFTRAYELDPAFPQLSQLFADTLLELGMVEEAIAPLETLIGMNELDDPKPLLDYAQCILDLNKQGSTKYPPMKALVVLNEVVQKYPDLLEALALIAETLVANGDHEMAFQAYREALDTSLADDKNWLERLSFGFGCVASTIGKYDVAIAALQEASHLNPGNNDIYKALSDAYIASGLPEDAVRTARNVLVTNDEDPDNLAWFARQVAILSNNDKRSQVGAPVSISKTAQVEALNALAKAIHLAPTRTDLLIQLGNFQSAIGAHKEAQATLSSLASLDFATIDDLKTASRFLSDIGDHVSAIACLENAILQDQNAAENHEVSIYIQLAQEHVKNNDQTSAINSLDHAIEVLPGENSLAFHKIDILLTLGQTIEALDCIELSLHENSDGLARLDMLILGVMVNRSTGDYSKAVYYAKQAVEIIHKDYDNFASITLPPRYRTQVAEIYRTLLQPEQARSILDTEPSLSVTDFNNEQEYLDFICLHTELSLETGDLIKADVQDIQLEATNAYFVRLMAITARLLVKAGNWKQAEKIFQVAINNTIINDQGDNKSAWSSAYMKYLTMYSLAEAALDLGMWDRALETAQKIRETSPELPLSSLFLAKVIVLQADFYNLCDMSEVTTHKPSMASISPETYTEFVNMLNSAKSHLDAYKEGLLTNAFSLTNDEIYRWQARADIAFKQSPEAHLDPVELLSHRHSVDNAAALIYYLHQVDLRTADRDSITSIIKIARSHSRHPGVILQVAFAIYDENPVDATKTLQAVIEQNPYAKSPMIAFCNILLAKIAWNSENYALARGAVENAINIWNDEPQWHMLASQIGKHISDPAEVLNHIEAATKLMPDNISYQLELGKAYFDNAMSDHRLLKQAETTFETALVLDPQEINVLTNLSRVQFLLQSYEAAEQNARKALLQDPNRAEIYQLLSEIAVNRNDYQGAYDYANKSIRLSPKDPQSTVILAHSLAALGRNNEALEKLNCLLSDFPESKPLHLERINIIRKLNGAKAGLTELRNLADKNPDDFEIMTALAKSYFDAGEFENAISVALQALKVHTEATPRNDLANLHLLIGNLSRQSGQIDQAIQYFTEAINLCPDYLEPYLELGLARKEQREYKQALEIFEQATTIAPEDPRASFQAGLAFKESKDYKSSETMLRKAVSLAPHDLNIRRQLAAVVALNLVHNPRSGRN